MSCFAGKTLLITGGTGSFGNMVLKRFLESDIKEIRIFSRDEKKQDDMRHHLQDTYPINIVNKVLASFYQYRLLKPTYMVQIMYLNQL